MVEIFGVPNIEYVGYGIGGIIILYILFRIFKSFGRGSRITEEEQELGIEKKEEDLTEKELSMESKERKIIKKIIRKLLDIHKNLQKIGNTTQIQIGGESIYLIQAVIVLINYLEKLIKSNIPIKREEAILSNIRNYWSVARQGLIEHLSEGTKPIGEELPYRYAATKADVAEINLLFEELGGTLRLEEEISEQKLKFVKQQYQLIVEEEGTFSRAA
ncbi:hypothetical protein HYW20_05835 [Candidatus Woesearchaeota archaeon]|nr:hypothetical protein [Candidatus Woesearchaeota archaeon]